VLERFMRAGSRGALTLRHIDPAQKQLHAFTRNLAGKVEIIG
jgi:hypothetical protein